MLVLLAILINIGSVQDFLSNKTADILAKKLKTTITIRNVRFHLFNKASIKDLFIADQTGDTLLYAGEAQIRISDLFFGGKTKTIHYLGLKDAKVNLHRFKDKDEWNYAFLIDAFGSGKKTQGSTPDFKLAIQKLELDHVQFILKDEWVGTDYEGRIGSFTLIAKQINFAKKLIQLSSISGNQLVFSIKEYAGGRPTQKQRIRRPTDNVDTTPFNPDLWRISLAKINLSNSHFYLDYADAKAQEGLFDANHLNITGIQTTINNIQIEGDTITGNILNLTAKERCGLTIKNMRGDISVSPKRSQCRNLYIQTGNSTVKNYFAMNYNRFPDFIDFIDKVKMEAVMDKSEIGIQDIVYFAPELKRFNNLSVMISGEASGIIPRLIGNNLELNDGFSSLKGSFVMNGLPNIDNTFLDFRNIVLHSSGAAALFYAPELKNQRVVQLQNLKNVDFSGNFTGYLRDFVAYGNIQTNLGNLKADINMKLPKEGMPNYSGHLSADNFATGQLINQNTIGNTSFSVKLQGKGFNPHTLFAQLNGEISKLYFNGYNYQNITVKGSFDKELFEGDLFVKDPNAIFYFKGKIDLTKESPSYDFEAIVNRLHLKTLNFSSDSFNVVALLNLNMKGNNLDDLEGKAFLSNVNLTRNGKRIRIDTLSLSSEIFDGGIHKISLSTKNAFATIQGKFRPTDLLNSSKMFFGYYLPEFIPTPKTFGGSEYLAFEVHTGETPDILSSIFPRLALTGGADLSGQVNFLKQELNVDGKFSKISWKNMTCDSIHITGLGDLTGIHLNVNVGDIHGSDEDLISKLVLSSTISRDTAKFQIQTFPSYGFGEVSLNGLTVARQDSLFIQFHPSQINFYNTVWEIPTGNEIVLAKKYVAIRNLIFESDSQKIEINPEGRSRLGNMANVTLQNIDLSPLNSILNLNGNKIGGLLNGTIIGNKLVNTPQFDFDLISSLATLNQDTLGKVRVKGHYTSSNNNLTFSEGSGIYKQSSRLAFLGSLYLKNNEATGLNGKITFDQADVSWLSPFLKGYVNNLTGRIDGIVDFSGSLSTPLTKGKLHLSNVSFSPDITGVTYNIPKGDIDIDPTLFKIDSIPIFDKEGNYGLLSGQIAHRGLQNFAFNIRLKSDKIKVVNQSGIKNQSFYGDIDAKVNMFIQGLWGDLTMHVIATPLSKSTLFLTLDNSSSELGSYNYITFGQTNNKKTEKHKYGGYGNRFSFILDALITPDLSTTLILDPETGDKFQAKGSGNIILNIPSDGDMKLNGNYIIQEGTYNFSIQQLQVLNYRRQFIINSGSSIKWNGGLSDADLDITAHTTVKARLYDLIAGEVDRLNLSKPEIRDAQLRQDIDVLMHMKGSLDEPKLSFEINLEEGRSIGTFAYQKLKRINTDEKQTLIQVSSLLLLGQFIPPEGLNTSTVSSGTINNMSELASAAASSQITNFTNKILGMKDFSVGVKYKNYSLSESQNINNLGYYNRNEAAVNLRKNFFDDRLIVEVGGVYDWGASNLGGNYTQNLAGDFRIQYLLTPDGRIRFSIFRTSEYDPIFSLKAIARQGVNINYRKSFNSLKGLFTSRKKISLPKKNNQEEEQIDNSDSEINKIKKNVIKQSPKADSTVKPLNPGE